MDAAANAIARARVADAASAKGHRDGRGAVGVAIGVAVEGEDRLGVTMSTTTMITGSVMTTGILLGTIVHAQGDHGRGRDRGDQGGGAGRAV